mmetsp:Transcript_35102/g.82661  ORF Transcript_35102/g.82661 Transcript_35102/m.82661 type:complete len:294 (-) Transcript_35102:239-1120(-)
MPRLAIVLKLSSAALMALLVLGSGAPTGLIKAAANGSSELLSSQCSTIEATAPAASSTSRLDSYERTSLSKLKQSTRVKTIFKANSALSSLFFATRNTRPLRPEPRKAVSSVEPGLEGSGLQCTPSSLQTSRRATALGLLMTEHIASIINSFDPGSLHPQRVLFCVCPCLQSKTSNPSPSAMMSFVVMHALMSRLLPFRVLATYSQYSSPCPKSLLPTRTFHSMIGPMLSRRNQSASSPTGHACSAEVFLLYMPSGTRTMSGMRQLVENCDLHHPCFRESTSTSGISDLSLAA